MSYWLSGLFECQHMREDLTQPHLSARMACGTGRVGRRQRVEAGDPGTPGLKSDSWRRHQGQRGLHGVGQCQRALTDLREGKREQWKMINWLRMQILKASSRDVDEFLRHKRKYFKIYFNLNKSWWVYLISLWSHIYICFRISVVLSASISRPNFVA